MEIKTKYNIGDIVFFYKEGVLASKIITGIRTRIDTRNHLFVTYQLEQGYAFKENELFRTARDFFKNVKIVDLQ